MKKNKFNPELLKEELKRFKMIENYDFYHEDKDIANYDKPLLLGSDLEEEENPEGNQDADNQAADQIGGDLGVDNSEEPVADMPPAEPAPADVPPPAPVEPASDDVEVDVTALVKGSEEAKDSANKASIYSAMLLKKLEDLENRVGDMDRVSQKIEDLEVEFKKRNPTDTEKLELRSLSSFPYSQKLSDYWSDKEGQYDVNDVHAKKEYVLTKQNLEQDYSEPQVKKSFDVNVNDYEEEDI